MEHSYKDIIKQFINVYINASDVCFIHNTELLCISAFKINKAASITATCSQKFEH